VKKITKQTDTLPQTPATFIYPEIKWKKEQKMARGIFRGATGRNFDVRTTYGKITSGNGRNALGSAGKGSAFRTPKPRSK
jgi:hypothetical protein